MFIKTTLYIKVNLKMT